MGGFRFWTCLTLVFLLTTSMQWKPKHVIFFGDSITEQGIKNNGYISLLKRAMDTTKFELTGAGVSGNKVYDLYLRLESDVLKKQPDVVVIYVGINDVWHKDLLHTGTDYDKYLQFYQALIDRIKAAGSKVICCTPTVIGELKNGENPQDAELDKYAAGIRQLAQKNSLPVCDLRKIFTEYEAAYNESNSAKGILTVDRVHLNATGNQLVADSLLPFLR